MRVFPSLWGRCHELMGLSHLFRERDPLGMQGAPHSNLGEGHATLRA